MSVSEIFEAMDYGPAPESDELAQAWLDRNARRFGLFIAGEFTSSQIGATFETRNPANGMLLAEVADASESDVDDAIAAARRAQKRWVGLKGTERARYLYAIARHLQKHARLFAVLETLDNGKTIRETRDIDVPLAVRHFYYHAGWAAMMETEFPDHAPHGVAGQIIPWNFPLLMLAWKVAPALAAGNTVVLKPAEQTPLTALLFAEICREIGLPKGVVNIVTGAGATGAALAAHPKVDKVAFTGSTDVGRKIREATAGQGKSLTLELGGKSPFVVFDDADLDSAVEGVVDSIWFNQGQVCCAGSRLLVQESVAQTMRRKLTDRLAKLRVGDPLDKSMDIGAIVSAEQLRRITSLVDQGARDGATVIQPSESMPKHGYFYPPTLVCDVGAADMIVQEEIFGPVLTMMSFRTPDEAVSLGNNTRYGLASSIWTENINLALGVAPRIRAGVVWVNCANLLDAAAGFGGMRESGFGREGGREGMLAYLKPRPAMAEKAARRTRLKSVAPQTGIDRTAKLYIGGRQVRPDSGYSLPVRTLDGTVIDVVGRGNRKDIRNAVEAARAASGWSAVSAFARSQVMFFIAENLSARAAEFAERLVRMTGCTDAEAASEVAASIDRLTIYAGYADKYDGAVHSVPVRGVVLAMNEPNGVMGIVCPDNRPLLGLISLVAPAIALGNRAVVIPGESHPLAATDLYQVLETSDVPAGVVNIVTGLRSEIVPTLADHLDVEAIWYFGPGAGVADVERRSAGNLKKTWAGSSAHACALTETGAVVAEKLARATQVKNIWIPYGE